MVEVYSALGHVREVERLGDGRKRHISEKAPGTSDPLFQLESKDESGREPAAHQVRPSLWVTISQVFIAQSPTKSMQRRAKHFNLLDISVKSGLELTSDARKRLAVPND
jgi:hypothetical protein